MIVLGVHFLLRFWVAMMLFGRTYDPLPITLFIQKPELQSIIIIHSHCRSDDPVGREARDLSVLAAPAHSDRVAGEAIVHM